MLTSPKPRASHLRPWLASHSGSWISIGFFLCCCCGAGKRFFAGVDGDGRGPRHSLAWTYSLVLASARLRADDLLRRRDHRDLGTEVLTGRGSWVCWRCFCCGGGGGGYEGVCCNRADLRASFMLVLMLALTLVAVVVVLVVSAVLGRVLAAVLVPVSVSLAITADMGIDSSAPRWGEALGSLRAFSGLGVASRVGTRGAGLCGTAGRALLFGTVWARASLGSPSPPATYSKASLALRRNGRVGGAGFTSNEYREPNALFAGDARPSLSRETARFSTDARAFSLFG